MKRLSVMALLAAAALLHADDRYRVYFGTYTGPKSKGIYRGVLDTKTGKLTDVALAAETTSPSFLAIHPTNKFLYAVGEAGKEGTVTAFAIDEKTGDLKQLNQQSARGGGPCHITVDKAGKNALIANYGSGSCAVLPIGTDGKLGEATGFQQHKGSSKAPNQKGPHAHSINLDAANRFAFCADLGLDKILIYRYDAAKGTIEPNDPAAGVVEPGSGPRHFAFHPSGKYAYVCNENTLTATAFRYDADKGSLTEIHTVSTLPTDTKDRKGMSTAEIVVHPSGKFVYVSNRGHNTIASFSVDEATGKLTPTGHQGKDIKTPRNFAIDPTGQYMIVANQSGGTVCVFKVDGKTGALEPTGAPVEVPSAVCVRYVPLGK